MCIKWIKTVFKYEKLPEEKAADENHDKNEIFSEPEIKFKKWYLGEFKEELQHNCFKNLLENNS